MRYIVLVIDEDSDAAKLQQAMENRMGTPRRVYVVGMEPASELALALDGTNSDVITLRDFNAQAMLNFPFAEAVGTEAMHAPFDQLVAFAKERAAQLQALRPETTFSRIVRRR